MMFGQFVVIYDACILSKTVTLPGYFAIVEF